MKLVLIRHGQTDSNLSGALDTAFPGRPLNETGQAQAEALPKKFSRLVGAEPTRIHASFILRAQQTAAPLAATFGLEVQTDEDLREILAGDLEMKTSREDTQVYLNTAIAWATGSDFDLRMPGGENGRETLERFDRGIERLTKGLGENDVAVAVIHGAIMRVWGARRLRGLTLDLIAQFPCQNCSMTVAEGSPESGWDLKLWSDQPPETWPVVPGGEARTSKETREILEKMLYR
ncbi:MAG: histidine phosphatase family protein [Mobiluncus porci]|uniref:histidine phosphatase family protein n=1 Tax=Mobiluncus porci TaxID=2652278 RepID=UPI0023F0AF04|nr:histidine phosphatase family protein [Mobiluncus porci]MDD7541500.1 histidine phosphatase family protein [Mobiluncus porci]MDY5748485.1 histidine phosphatase family protein [Mobiluncus porci]